MPDPTYMIPAEGAELKYYKDDPWPFIGGAVGISDDGFDWTNAMAENGVSAMDAGGKLITSGNELKERVKGGSVYLFLRGKENPYMLKTGEDGMIYVSDSPVELNREDLPTLAEEKVAKFKNTDTRFTETDQLSDPETGEIRNLRIDTPVTEKKAPAKEKIVLTEEELSYTDPAKVLPKPLPKLPGFKGIPLDRDMKVPEEFDPNLFPPGQLKNRIVRLTGEQPAPQTLGTFEKFWDGLVKLFNGVGSEKGAALRKAEKDRADFKKDYKKWAEKYNRTVDSRRELKPEYDRGVERLDKATEFLNSPRYKEYLAQQAEAAGEKRQSGPISPEDELRFSIDKRREEAARDIVHLGTYRKMMENPVLAEADRQKNGCTIDNIGAYAKALGENLRGRKAQEIPEEELAEYLLAKNVGDLAKKEIQHNINNSAKYNQLLDRFESGDKSLQDTLAHYGNAVTDYRATNTMLSEINDPARRKEAIDRVRKSAEFRTALRNYGDRRLSLSQFEAEVKDAGELNIDRRYKEFRADLVKKLGDQPVGEKTRELLAKIKILDTVTEDPSYMTATNNAEKAKILQGYTAWVNVDFGAAKNRLKEIELSGKKPKMSEIRQKRDNKETLTAEETEYYLLHTTARKYSDTLAAHPEIGRFVEENEDLTASGKDMIRAFDEGKNLPEKTIEDPTRS